MFTDCKALWGTFVICDFVIQNTFKLNIYYNGLHGGVVANGHCCLPVRGSRPSRVRFTVWAVLCGVCMFSGFLPQSKDMQLRLTGGSKLAIGVNGCLSKYERESNRSRVPSPNVSWNRLFEIGLVVRIMAWNIFQYNITNGVLYYCVFCWYTYNTHTTFNRTHNSEN